MVRHFLILLSQGFFFIPPSVLEGYYTHISQKSAAISCADLWSKINWMLGFYDPSSSIADATCGIFMAQSSNYCGGIPIMVVTALFGKKNPEYFHIVPLWDILPDSISAHTFL